MKKGSRSVRGGGCALFKPQFRRSKTRPDKTQAANRKLAGYLSVLGVQLTLVEPAGAAWRWGTRVEQDSLRGKIKANWWKDKTD